MGSDYACKAATTGTLRIAGVPLSRTVSATILGAFVLGIFLTPPDMISQTLLAVPVYLLYELGIIMSKIFAIREEEPEEEAAAAE